MIGIKTKSGFLDFAKIDFKCPFCNENYLDANDKYLNRCNKNKSGYTKIKCSCGNKFGMTYNCRGNAVSFDLKN